MTDDTIHVPAQQPKSSPCKIAFLGEAPSSEELLEGKPLVGPAGKVFDAMLRTANLDRSEYWVGNVFDQKLPGNELANWCVNKNEANPEWDPEGSDAWFIPGDGVLRPEYRWHIGRLHDELAAVRPNVVVPMGDTALWAMTGHIGIGMQRGNLGLSNGWSEGIKLLPTYHPSYVRKEWKMYSVVVADFMKAARAAEEGPGLIWPDKTVILAPTLTEIIDYTDNELMKSSLICPDIETGWGQMTCIGFAANPYSSICIPFIDLSKPNKSYWPSVDHEFLALMIVKKIMESPIPKLGQNFAAYDAFWLLDRYGIKTMNLLHDTRLLHHALYPELPKSLSFMAGSYTMQGAWKKWGHKGQQEKRDD